MTGLYSALASMAFTSVALAGKVGAILGLLVGAALAYVPIARVLRAMAESPRTLTLAWRRFAGVCCLLWGLALPTAFCAAMKRCEAPSRDRRPRSSSASIPRWPDRAASAALRPERSSRTTTLRTKI